MLTRYRTHRRERAALGVPPQPLDERAVEELVSCLRAPGSQDVSLLRSLLAEQVPVGVDPAARVKAHYLRDVAQGRVECDAISPEYAVELLGTMVGGHNVPALIELLDHPSLGDVAAKQLGATLLVFDAFHDVVEKASGGNTPAKTVLDDWASGAWFLNRPEVPEVMTLTVFRVEGEVNTDDLSPAQEAWSRPDTPLHAQAMLRNPRPGLSNALEELQRLRALGNPIAFVGDIVGTGSSRKSAVNSLLWHIGQSVPYVPNKSVGGVVLAGKIAPIFFNTLEDAGALPIECDVSTLAMGDTLAVYPHTGKICDRSGNVIADFQLKTNVLLDEVRAGGRIPLIVGRTLTERAREHLGLPPSEVFASPVQHQSERAYSLAQKIVGRACGTDGISPGTYCEPRVSTVGSQDTTGPMTRDELTELACSGFAADLVLQTFCHTVAYPKPVDVTTQRTLPDFMTHRGGVSLRPGDGIIHSWLNRMLLPDQVGTGADSHTRFPLGISFPAGSGLVAFAAAMGVMPLDMPESVRVRFVGERQPGVTLRDLVNAIPYVASQRGLLTVSGRESTSPGSAANVFSGRILEVEGLGDLTVEQAFEFSDATAERSAAGCTFELSVDSVARYLRSNVVMLRWMIDQGYQDARALRRRAEAMEAWLAAPELLRADRGATYVAEIDIDMTSIVEPLLACPNDPDDVRTLSAVSGQKIDEVFIGSCMTNIGHFRAAGELLKDVEAVMPTRLWLAPPTKMDETTLRNEGYYSVYAKAGARTEMPGCSLCMGNQARVAPGAVVVSTSTRNFPNRLGQGAQVYLASAELAAVAAVLGRLPTSAEYATRMAGLDPLRGEIYRYMDFDKMPAFVAPTATAVSAPVRLGLH